MSLRQAYYIATGLKNDKYVCVHVVKYKDKADKDQVQPVILYGHAGFT